MYLNKNDIIELIGPPSTKTHLIMIYIYILKEKLVAQNLKN